MVATAPTPQSTSPGFRLTTLLQRRVSTQALIVFTRQLTSLLKSGISLAESLSLISSVSDDRKLNHALRDIARQIQVGRSLTDSLRRHPLVFRESYIAMVAAGEAAGRLDEILDRLAGSLEKLEKTRKQIVGAAVGPAITGGLTFLIVIGLTIFVVPMFEQTFAQAKVPLPLLTQTIVGISQFLRSPLAPLGVMAGLGAGIYLQRIIRREPLLRYQLDLMLLKLPLVGGFISKSITASMLRVLATLLDAGISITDALQITQETVRNQPYRLALRDARAQVAIGGSLAQSLSRHAVVPSLFCRLLAVGEESGDMFSMLNRAATIFEDDLELATKAVSQAIEPLLTIVVSGTVGIILIGLYLPLFNMGSTMMKLQMPH